MLPLVLIENAEEHEYMERLEKSLDFFRRIFGKDFTSVYFSNASELSDYRFAGGFIGSDNFQHVSYSQLCKQWDAAVIAKITTVYKVGIQSTHLLLKDIFEQCLQGQSTLMN